MSKINEPIKYESMVYYARKIKEAKTPLGILLNMDYLTDLMDEKLKEMRK